MAFYSPFKLAVLCALFHAPAVMGRRKNVDCYTGDGRDYRGFCSDSYHHKCQKWTDQAPHTHTRYPTAYSGYYARVGDVGDHNYCRNPDGENAPWCYTTNPYYRWGYCGVPACWCFGGGECWIP